MNFSLDTRYIPTLVQISVADPRRIVVTERTAYLTPADHGCDSIESACEQITHKIVSGYLEYGSVMNVSVRPL